MVSMSAVASITGGTYVAAAEDHKEVIIEVFKALNKRSDFKFFKLNVYRNAPKTSMGQAIAELVHNDLYRLALVGELSTNKHTPDHVSILSFVDDKGSWVLNTHYEVPVTNFSDTLKAVLDAYKETLKILR